MITGNISELAGKRGKAKKRFPELEEKLLDEYYKMKGWNNDGIPTAESLNDLGLEFVSEDFLKRGILTED